MTTIDPTIITSIHEQGHIWACAYFGLPIVYTTPNEVAFMCNDVNPLSAIGVAVAGAAAEILAFGSIQSDCSQLHGDIEMFVDLQSPHPVGWGHFSSYAIGIANIMKQDKEQN